MKHKKTLAAIQEYIANFDPAEFSSDDDFNPSLIPANDRVVFAQKIKTRIQRKRELSECLLSTGEPEKIITQEEVDSLVEEWKISR